MLLRCMMEAVSISGQLTEMISLTPAGRFPSTRIVHRLATERRAIRNRTIATPRQRSTITSAKVEIMIYMAIEATRSVIPGSCSNEHSV
jgi:hypothetical protein